MRAALSSAFAPISELFSKVSLCLLPAAAKISPSRSEKSYQFFSPITTNRSAAGPRAARRGPKVEAPLLPAPRQTTTTTTTVAAAATSKLASAESEQDKLAPIRSDSVRFASVRLSLAALRVGSTCVNVKWDSTAARAARRGSRPAGSCRSASRPSYCYCCFCNNSSARPATHREWGARR